MDDSRRDLIYRSFDGSISSEEFERLQNAIEHDEEFRLEYVKAVELCETLSDIAEESNLEHQVIDNRSSLTARSSANSGRSRFSFQSPQIAMAIAVLVLVGSSAFLLGRKSLTENDVQNIASEESRAGDPEIQIAGHATLRRFVEMKWAKNGTHWLEGDILPNGKIAFDKGVAEIDFFCGATLIVEGPAELEIESDWSVRVFEGRVRANVPPAARGFIVKAADTEIVDLGTEFAIEVGENDARVEVIDGEVKLRGGVHDGKHLLTGEGELLAGSDNNAKLSENLSTELQFKERRQIAEEKRFTEWQNYSRKLQTDERLIAYFPITTSLTNRSVRNQSPSGSQFDALTVGPVESTLGRFGPKSAGLGFDRLGARVRTRIDGEFQAFTFSCWVRIDRLGHRYNALFMGDGFENGEPHWQIRDDGRLMISVMVDDSQEIKHFSELERRVVTDAGLHKNYISEPFWDLSKSGQWFHLVAVYDPANRRVQQFVNGRVVCDEQIVDRLLAKTLRIGPAEIGNWGQPFRKTPEFAIRNLHGTIDELAIFNAALSQEEISVMYEQGKPLGY